MSKVDFNNMNSDMESFEKFDRKQRTKRIESKKDLYRKARNNKQHDKYSAWEE